MQALTFSDMNLSSTLLHSLEKIKYHTPSPIQQQTIPLLLQGRDVIGQAQTGTGKTAAFVLPILQNLNYQVRHTQALILTPTRELAIQVADHIEILSASKKEMNIAVLCGGQDYRTQLQKLKAGAHIVVGTPGRILDHLNRKSLNLSKLSTLVLDEADEMLRMGFIEDVELILDTTPDTKQVALFSATMPSKIRQIAKAYLNNPASIEIKSETATVKSIDQKFVFASPKEKPTVLLRILEVLDYEGMIVFVRTKSGTEELATLLQQQGLRAMPIHGDLTQAIRERMVEQFRQGAIDILVATDVAARGLDVSRVTHVINYDMAHDSETYVHRIGRTGRAGRSGTTILFVTPRESRMLTMIERHTRQRIQKMAIPSDEMMLESKRKRFLDNILSRLNHSHLREYHELIERYVAEHKLSIKEVAAALALQLNQDKPLQTQTTHKHKDSQERTSKAFKRYRIEVGRAHGVKPGNIVGAIANESGLPGHDIINIKIFDNFSTLRLPNDLPKNVLMQINKARVCGKPLTISEANH